MVYVEIYGGNVDNHKNIRQIKRFIIWSKERLLLRDNCNYGDICNKDIEIGWELEVMVILHDYLI